MGTRLFHITPYDVQVRNVEISSILVHFSLISSAPSRRHTCEISLACLFQLGYSVLSRGSYVPLLSRRPLSLLHQSLRSLESIMKCVQMSWMVILVGPASVGKTSLVQLLAHLTGHTLKIMAMNSAMDTTELLGGFEQVNGLPSHFQAKHI